MSPFVSLRSKPFRLSDLHESFLVVMNDSPLLQSGSCKQEGCCTRNHGSGHWKTLSVNNCSKGHLVLGLQDFTASELELANNGTRCDWLRLFTSIVFQPAVPVLLTNNRSSGSTVNNHLPLLHDREETMFIQLQLFFMANLLNVFDHRHFFRHFFHTLTLASISLEPRSMLSRGSSQGRPL